MTITTRKTAAAASNAETTAAESLKRKKPTPAPTSKNTGGKRQKNVPEPPCDPVLMQKVLDYHNQVTNRGGSAPTMAQKGQKTPTAGETLSTFLIWKIACN